jgi:armadillo repeat-containing protein 8
MKYLQDMSNPQLRVVAVWCIINLTYPNSPGAVDRILRLRENGVEAHLQKMADDPCLDVKVRDDLLHLLLRILNLENNFR